MNQGLTDMAWIIELKRGETITINGCRVMARAKCAIALLDHADVLLPNGTFKPRPSPEVTEQGS